MRGSTGRGRWLLLVLFRAVLGEVVVRLRRVICGGGDQAGVAGHHLLPADERAPRMHRAADSGASRGEQCGSPGPGPVPTRSSCPLGSMGAWLEDGNEVSLVPGDMCSSMARGRPSPDSAACRVLSSVPVHTAGHRRGGARTALPACHPRGHGVELRSARATNKTVVDQIDSQTFRELSAPSRLLQWKRQTASRASVLPVWRQ
jgi:hypothetical protein